MTSEAVLHVYTVMIVIGIFTAVGWAMRILDLILTRVGLWWTSRDYVAALERIASTLERSER